MQYRAEIDGLRSVAVVPVILFHAGVSLFSGGYVGVDVFFVISGYLITSILLADLERGRFSIASFYERRARRILPALFVVTICTVPFAVMWMLPLRLVEYGRSLVAVMAFVSNVEFWREEGYFAAAAELKPLLHTWSLAVEEQFYLLFPPALWLGWRLVRAHLAAAILVVAIASLALSEVAWRFAPTANFYLAPFRAWELLAGSLCALSIARSGRKRNDLIAAAGLGAIAFAIFAFDASTPFPGVYALVPVIGTALIILFADEGTWVARALSLRPFVFIGLISYSAYLWHQPLFAFARLRSVGEPAPVLLAGLIAATFVLAWLSWRFVEKPFRKAGQGPAPTRKAVFAFSLAGMAVIAATGLVIVKANGFPSRFDMPATVTRDLVDRVGEADCMDRRRQDIARPDQWFCRLGKRGGGHVIAVYGDSHSISFLPALDRWAKDEGHELWFSALSSCAPVEGVAVLRNDDRQADCAARNRQGFSPAVLDRLDGAILIGRWAYYMGGDPTGEIRYVGTGETIEKDPAASTRIVLRQLAHTADLFRSKGVPLVIVHQAPVQVVEPGKAYFMTSIAGGAVQDVLDRSSVSLAAHRSAYSAVARSIDDIAARYPQGVTTVDLAPRLCAAGTCRIGSRDHAYWFDANHLSHSGAALVVGEVTKPLRLTKDVRP